MKQDQSKSSFRLPVGRRPEADKQIEREIIEDLRKIDRPVLATPAAYG